MSLSSGQRLGPYEIVTAIGAGGMGEVYKARDTRLDRTVAIKVLPATLAGDPQFRERFEREAKSISALNHPNICTLYDVGRDNHVDFLVMEYLEGETLAAGLAKGPLALPDALRTAAEIASALDKAHRQGIVHRDLKPGNVMLTKGGAKLLDFGLAKMGPAGVHSGAVPTTLPTATAPLTAEGTLLGTFQYMAPEQIEGEEADARTDIFAFGAVLYEMLTGRKAFQGKSQASLLGAILKDEPPPVSQVQPIAPPALDYLVRTCLAKDPDNRFQSAHDLLLQLRWIIEGGSAAGIPAPVVAHRKQRERALWAGIAIAAMVLGGAAAWWLKLAPAEHHVITKFTYPLPEGQNFTRTGRHIVAISPDGTKLAYVANQQLYLRAMDQLGAQPIRGTNEDPMEPVFSPDGQWIAYFVPTAGGNSNLTPWSLKKIAVAGGAPVTLGQAAAAPFGASWRGSTIVFGISAEKVSGVQAVPDSGGVPQTIVPVDSRKDWAAQPQLTDDGKHVLFVVMAPGGADDDAQIVLQALDGGVRKVLVKGGTNPHLLRTGHLVYIHGGTLLGVPFDATRLEVTGGPVPLVEGVSELSAIGTGQFAISSDGTLVYRPGTSGTGTQRSLVWVDRQGHDQPLSAKPQAYQFPRISPDGSRIAVTSADEENDIWVFDIKTETLTRLTFGPASEVYSPWMPDGRRVLFSSGDTALSSARDIFRKAADGTGPTEALTKNKSAGAPSSISPDGKVLVYRTGNAGEANDLMLLPLDGSGQSRPLLADPKLHERNGEISPDGRWIAYESDESSRYEVYVRPFPAVDTGKWQISSEGGAYPLWARSGKELFFVSQTGTPRLMVVPVQPTPSFTFGKAQPLFELTAFYAPTGRTYDISPDGNRFLMVKLVGSDASVHPSLVVVSHWLDEVLAKVPGRR